MEYSILDKNKSGEEKWLCSKSCFIRNFSSPSNPSTKMTIKILILAVLCLNPSWGYKIVPSPRDNNDADGDLTGLKFFFRTQTVEVRNKSQYGFTDFLLFV